MQLRLRSCLARSPVVVGAEVPVSMEGTLVAAASSCMPVEVIGTHRNTAVLKLAFAVTQLCLAIFSLQACSDSNKAPQAHLTTQLAATAASDPALVWDLYDDFSGDLSAWRLENPTKAILQNGRVLLNGDQGAVELNSRVPVNGRAIRITGIKEEYGRCWEVGLDDNTTSRHVRLVRDDPDSTDLIFGRRPIGPLPEGAVLDLEIVPGNDAYAYKITNGATVVASGSLPFDVPTGAHRISLLSYCGTRVSFDAVWIARPPLFSYDSFNGAPDARWLATSGATTTTGRLSVTANSAPQQARTMIDVRGRTCRRTTQRKSCNSGRLRCRGSLVCRPCRIRHLQYQP